MDSLHSRLTLLQMVSAGEHELLLHFHILQSLLLTLKILFSFLVLRSSRDKSSCVG
jgi:hypothetical protein